MAHLRKATGVSVIRPEMRLALELGLDSLARVELQAFIETEFGFPQERRGRVRYRTRRFTGGVWRGKSPSS